MAYERPPNPGTYYIKSVAAPKNVIEVQDFNQERAVCSPQAEKPATNQQWYIQRSGRGYKIKNVKHGVYLVPHSTQPKAGTVIGASPDQGQKAWSIMRTHEGFAIQYGEDELEIDLHYGLDKAGNAMHLWSIAPQHPCHRWKFEKIRLVTAISPAGNLADQGYSDDVGSEEGETIEDRVAALSDQLQKMVVETATKDRLLAQKEQELQEALKVRREVPVKVIETQLAELRQKIETLECLVKSYSDHSEQPNNIS